ncbi:MAG: ABC transporter permease DevC [Candidatus Sumerlaeia bacterium]|nr:ABC transporter permease DevC [Candidatus Sumerlaeia bacterium]
MRKALSQSSAALGWRQLSHGRTRMLIALMGVSVAVLLMLLVLSLKETVFRSSLQVASSLNGDLILLSPKTQTVQRPARFPRRFADRLRAIEGVEKVSVVYVETGRWINPWTRQQHNVRVYGLELDENVIGLDGIDPSDPVFRLADVALFDRRSRPKIGPVAAELDAGREFSTEVNSRRIQVTGAVTGGITVGIDGNLFTTHANFQRMFPTIHPGAADIGIVKLAPGADAEQVLAVANSMLGSEGVVYSRRGLLDKELAYLRKNEPVDFIMSLIASVAFVVGMIIVYQILYTDVINHLPQFATLKAMGFGDGFLLRIILSQGLILSLIGFWPGLLGARILARAAQKAISLPVEVTPDRIVQVMGMTVVMCAVAAGLAVHKLSSADPADVF